MGCYQGRKNETKIVREELTRLDDRLVMEDFRKKKVTDALKF